MEALTLLALAADDTRSIGEAIGRLLEPRDAVVLTGELGAGKTTFVQGVARGAGVEDQVSSPTFVLVKEYVGRVTIAHVDVYRLSTIQDVVDLSLDEVADGDAVLLVEWGDAVEELLPADRLRVELVAQAPDGSDEARRVRIEAVGDGWEARRRALADAVEPWRTAS